MINVDGDPYFVCNRTTTCLLTDIIKVLAEIIWLVVQDQL